MDNNILNKHTKGILFLAGNKSYAPQIVANNGEEMQYKMNTVCTPYGNNDQERIANAERIVKTWNNYDSLLEALKEAQYELKKWQQSFTEDEDLPPILETINEAIKKAEQ